jgi:23S rRNA pseudouridine2605 synthase
MKKKTKKSREERTVFYRLNKYIAESGICSRRKADELIAAGKVSVNRKIVTKLGTKVKATDFITVNGDPIQTAKKYTYILLNKPKNTISTTNDEKDRTTVLDIVRSRSRIYPIGRLDRNTTGVLLLTNDGEMANRLTHPKYQIPRIYKVGIDKPLLERDAARIASGVKTEDFESSPCELIIDPADNSKITLVLREGKNHEVKKIFEAFGYTVKKLDRTMFAGITIKGLSRGEYRHLDNAELNHLKRLTGLH